MSYRTPAGSRNNEPAIRGPPQSAAATANGQPGWEISYYTPKPEMIIAHVVRGSDQCNIISELNSQQIVILQKVIRCGTGNIKWRFSLMNARHAHLQAG